MKGKKKKRGNLRGSTSVSTPGRFSSSGSSLLVRATIDYGLLFREGGTARAAVSLRVTRASFGAARNTRREISIDRYGGLKCMPGGEIRG